MRHRRPKHATQPLPDECAKLPEHGSHVEFASGIISRAWANSRLLRSTTEMVTFVSDQTIVLLFGSLVPEVTVTEVTIIAEGIQMTAHVLALSAPCPYCGTVSTAVHSYSTRQPRDLPLSGQAVRLLLHLRRFRCRDATCPAATFSEPLPTLDLITI